jgi:hypothetical protein
MFNNIGNLISEHQKQNNAYTAHIEVIENENKEMKEKVKLHQQTI